MDSKAFREGKDAHGRGLPLTACTYPEGSEERLQWSAGWGEASSLAARDGGVDPTEEPLDALRATGALRPGAGPIDG